MGTTDITLKEIFGQLVKCNVGLAIAETETYLAAWPNPQTSEKLDTLKTEYQLMTRYWQQGVKDPQLEEQYLRLLQRLYVLCGNIAVYRHMNSTSYLQGLYTGVRRHGGGWSLREIRREMESFVSDAAMLELEPEHKRAEKSQTLYKQHQQQMNALFNYVVTSNIWTDGIAREMEELLLAPTVDSVDQQLLVSAVMLSLMNRFDMAKFRLLTHVYQHSQDEQMRQRALVGWALALDDDWLGVYPEQRDIVRRLLQSKRVCQELTELQMQLVYTMNVEKDTNTIRQEIMPDLMEAHSFRITRDGIEEKPEDPLEDILHPDASERRMEKLEASFHRMIDMQKQGADIYFGGFSQMKRFPFFYDIGNWFVPFYMQHPDIAQFVSSAENNAFLEKLVMNGPFCNSDKYSFVIAFQQVLKRIPENLRQMMNHGDVPMNEELMTDEQHSPAFIRRSYLMDLSRFFRLFPNRTSFFNPFDTSSSELGQCLFMGSASFAGTPLERYKPEVVAVLRKQGMKYTSNCLLYSYPQEMQDVQYYLWLEDYAAVLELEPDNERALAGRARELFDEGTYDEAEDYYDRLLLLHPGKTGYMLNKAVCLVNMEEYEDAQRLLYQLNYEHPEDTNVLRVLAWALTCGDKLEQAEKLYLQLADSGQTVWEDYQNHGYCLWLQGRIAEAAACLRKYCELSAVRAENAFSSEIELLKKKGISDTEIKMMEALVAEG